MSPNPPRTSIMISESLESTIEQLINKKLSHVHSMHQENNTDVKFLKISFKKLDRSTNLLKKCWMELDQLQQERNEKGKQMKPSLTQSHI